LTVAMAASNPRLISLTFGIDALGWAVLWGRLSVAMSRRVHGVIATPAAEDGRCGRGKPNLGSH